MGGGQARADAGRAASYQRYFKEPVDYLGLDREGSEGVRRELLERVGESWTIVDAVRFCDAMLRDPHMEARGTGYQV